MAGLMSRMADAILPARKARAMIVPSEDWPGLFPSPWAGWPSDWRTPLWNSGGGLSGDLWARVSTVLACADLITRSLGSMPIRIMKAGIESPERPMWTYDPAPGIYASINDMTDQMVMSLLLRGNAFLYSLNEYSTGYPRQIIVLDPDQITIEMVGGMPVYYIGPEKYRLDDLERSRLCHIKYLSWPGEAWGIGPLDALARQMGISESLEEYTYDLARSGAIPWGVLTTEQEINREQAELLKKRWLEAAADREGAPAILSGGLTLQPLTLKPSDLALLDISTMSERRIATAFGIQPFLLGIPMEGSSGMMQYANVTMITDILWRLTLRPLATSISASLSKWALPYGSDAIFDSDSFTRPDPKTQAETLEILTRIQVMTVDEARMARGLPPTGVNVVQAPNPTQRPNQEVL